MYYISKNDVRDGPFSIEELRNKRLTDDMLSWKEGMDNWVPIRDIPELRSLVIATPPPLPSEKVKEREVAEKKQNKELRKSIIANSLFIGAGIASVISYIVNEVSYTSDWPDEYHIFHSPAEESNHLLSYVPILLVWLLVVEIVALILAWIRIEWLNNIEKEPKQYQEPPYLTVERSYLTDKGAILVQQKSADRIYANDRVITDLRAVASDGKYSFNNGKTFIIVKDGAVASIL